MKLIRILFLACLACSANATAVAQEANAPDIAQKKKSVHKQSNIGGDNLGADKLLSLGDFYFRSNDISDAADRYYKQAIRNSPGSQTAGYAQYNRGSYWFRKFYVVREQSSKQDRSALSEAEGQYYDFIDKFATQTNTVGLLSDAQFYLALVYLQQGKRDYAVGWLNRMLAEAVKTDQSVYVYKVVWSSRPGDIVDRNVDAAGLANYARHAIQTGSDMETVILDIKRWCQRQ